MAARGWAISQARSSFFGASVLISALMFVSSQLALAQFTQQGPKLVGTGAVGGALQGSSVALSGDGTTAIVGGYQDNGRTGAAWVYTRSGGVWTQQGSKLVHPSGIEGLIFGSWGYAIRREASLRRSSGRAWPWWR
jgi:hypothetical protein